MGRLSQVALGVGGVAGAAAVGLIALGGSGSAPSSTAEITVIETLVERTGPAGFVTATTGDVVEPGQQVRTDESGMAQLDFGDGSMARLGPGTEFELVELDIGAGERQVKARLDLGETWHQVADLTGTEDADEYSVETAVATASVRGTALAVECLVRDVCTVTVHDGEVEVDPVNGDPLTLRAGQLVTVTASGPGPVEDLSPDELLGNPWIERNASLDLAASTDGSATRLPPRIEGPWRIDASAVDAPDGFGDRGPVSRTHLFELVGCDDPPCELEVVVDTTSGRQRLPVAFDGTSYSYQASFPVACGDVANALTTTVRWELAVTADDGSPGLRRATAVRGSATETQLAGAASACRPAELRHSLTGAPA